MIKNMLKRRKESDTYLATFRRHRWSTQMTMKKDNLLELSASTAAEEEVSMSTESSQVGVALFPSF